MDPLYPEPPEALARLRLRHLATYVGPGVIIASVTIGSGELVWASRSGAIFGYTMLWCFLYAGLFKAVQVYSAARHITLTGEHPMVAWGMLPGPRCWFPLLIALPALAAMPVAFSAIPEMLGGFVHRLAGLPQDRLGIGAWSYLELWTNFWATCVLTLCLLLASASNYKLLEVASIVVLGLMVACIGLSVVVLTPALHPIISGLLVPRVVDYPAWVLSDPSYAAQFEQRSRWLEVAVYLGAVGGGAYDYIGYIGMLREKRWGLAGRRVASREELDRAVSNQGDPRQTMERARRWMRAPLLDTGISFFFVILVTLLFAILGTLVLHRQQAIPAENNFLSQQEGFLTVLHPELRWLYRAAVFLAFLGTLYGAFEVYQHTFAESMAAVFPNWTNQRRTGMLRRGIVRYCFLGGLLLIWLPASLAGNVEQRVTFTAVISGATAGGLWCFAMLWADYVRLPAPLRMSNRLRVMVVVAGVVAVALGVQTVIAYSG